MIANAERGELNITVGDKSYILKLTMKVLVALQKKTGQTFGQTLRAVTDLDAVAITNLVWMMLQTHHGKEFQHEDRVIQFIEDAGGLPVMVKVLGDSLKAAMAPAKSAGDADGDPQ